MFLTLDYFAICRMCVLFENCGCCHRGWICFGVRAVLAPGGKFLEGVSFSWFGPSYKLHVGVLEMLHRSRGRSSKFALDEWGVIGGDCKISVFNYYLCFDVIWSILQFLCYVFLFACLWASVYIKADFLAWKRGRGQVFNTHCVQVFMPIVSRTFVLWWHPGSWGGSFPRGPRSRFWLKGE